MLKGDALELLFDVKDGSVDLILTDPPFGTTQSKWDVIIPFELLWPHLKRVRRQKAATVLFGSEPFSSLQRVSNIKEFKYDWCWRKPKGTGHLNAKKMPMNDMEMISVFFGCGSWYIPQFSHGDPYKDKAGKDHSSNSSMSGCYGDYTNFRNDNNGNRYPKRVIEFGVVERGTLHPNQKPLNLMEYLIRTYTKPGNTVMDFAMGSGTTGVAAKILGRNFIGIEKDAEYFKIAQKRINATVKMA